MLFAHHRLLSKTHVSIASDASSSSDSGNSSSSSVQTASLFAKGAKLRNTYSSKSMSGFVLDLPDEVDEEDVVAKLNAHDDIVKVVPDTWVGIAGAAGAAVDCGSSSSVAAPSCTVGVSNSNNGSHMRLEGVRGFSSSSVRSCQQPHELTAAAVCLQQQQQFACSSTRH